MRPLVMWLTKESNDRYTHTQGGRIVQTAERWPARASPSVIRSGGTRGAETQME